MNCEFSLKTLLVLNCIADFILCLVFGAAFYPCLSVGLHD